MGACDTRASLPSQGPEQKCNETVYTFLEITSWDEIQEGPAVHSTTWYISRSWPVSKPLCSLVCSYGYFHDLVRGAMSSFKRILDFCFRFYLLIFRERRREGEGEKQQCIWSPLAQPLLGTQPATQAYALTGNQTGNPLICRLVLSPLSHIIQGETGFFLPPRYFCLQIILKAHTHRVSLFYCTSQWSS